MTCQVILEAVAKAGTRSKYLDDWSRVLPFSPGSQGRKKLGVLFGGKGGVGSVKVSVIASSTYVYLSCKRVENING